jgi:hypothetical protein
MAVWADTRVDLPFMVEGEVLRDALSGVELTVQGGGIAMGDILAHAPVAVLVRPGPL